MIDQVDSFDDHEITIASKEGACVNIVVDQDEKHGMIQSLVYRPTSHNGTILMLQGALRYVFTKYKKLRYLTLNDKSSVAKKDIHITAKRLLQQRKGWYEEWFGAVIDDKDMATTRLMKALAIMQPTQQDREIMMAPSWGSTKEVEDMARRYLGKESSSIIGTAWKITRRAVAAFPIEIREEMSGGNIPRSTLPIVSKHMTKMYRMWKRLAYGNDIRPREKN